VAYNFKTGNNKIKLLKEYENILKMFYLETLYWPLMPVRKYDAIPQN
jgi:hypothetical protein